MKAFVVSREHGDSDVKALVSKLSSIHVEPQANTTIIAVADRYSLKPSNELSPEDILFCEVDDFIHRNGAITSNAICFSPNQIDKMLCKADGDWIVIDCGMHTPETVCDFIQKIALYFYMRPPAPGLNIVILADGVHMPTFLREANKSFNCLAAGQVYNTSASDVNVMFLSATIEKFAMGFSLFAIPVALARSLSLRLKRLRPKHSV